MANLTTMDIKLLAEQPSAQARSVLASKLAKDCRIGNFSAVESIIVNDIFRILIKDVDVVVRHELAKELAYCNDVPRDIVLSLANDEVDVAELMLRFSTLLTEDDLMTIVSNTKEMKRLLAVSQRETVSEKVSGCLLKTGNGTVIKSLCANAGATLGEEALNEYWSSISKDKAIMETLVNRGNLPLTVAEKLFFAVSESLKQKLVTQYNFNTPSVRKAVSNVREWQMLGIMPAQSGLDPRDDEHIDELVVELNDNGRLSYSLLMRALCTGNLQLFEAGIAKLAGVPRVNARILLMDKGSLGFEAIYKAANMPEGFLEAVETLLRISFEETEYGRVRREDFRKRVIERIYQSQYHRTIENMDYVLSIIGGKIAASASVH